MHLLYDMFVQDDRRPSTVVLSNTGSQKATFCLLAEASRQWWGQPQGHDAGLPDWLEAYPVHGSISPQVRKLAVAYIVTQSGFTLCSGPGLITNHKTFA